MTAQTEIWRAPAKLNLFLHVTGRRADGYHTLQTAFVLIDYCDLLWFDVNNTGEIKRLDESGQITIELPENDLCVQAAYLLQKTTSTKHGATIHLQKNIASGAGLGGGSSDAATVLLALNQLWNVQLDRAQLMALGSKLGADVPVFINGENALAEGIGDILHPFNAPKTSYCVLIPQIHVNTAQIFNDYSLTQDTAIKTIRGSSSSYLHYVQGNMIHPDWRNDLQAITCQRFEQVNRVFEALNTDGKARMSGTGSSIFIDCDTYSAAQDVLNRQLSKFDGRVDGFAARGLACHPHKL